MSAFKFIPKPQSYQWGAIGNQGAAGAFWKAVSDKLVKNHNNLEKFSFYNDKSKFAEIWFGLHPKCENYQIPSFKKLEELISAEKCPFLLKILSCTQPLSLQLHPDARLAENLHRKNPQKYPEYNAKPEMSIALSDNVQMLCGFYEPHERAFLRLFFEKILCNDFDSIYSWSKDEVFRKAKEIRETYNKHTNVLSDEAKNVYRVFNLLNEQYHGDNAIFCPFFMKYYKLTKYEAIYIAPLTLHVYLCGDMIEIMQSSDFTIRGGLTKKPVDIDTFLNHYSKTPSHESIIEPKNFSKGFNLYKVPNVPFFEVYHLIMDPQSEVSPALESHREFGFLVVLNGSGMMFVENTYTEISYGDSYMLLFKESSLTFQSKSNPLELIIASGQNQ